MEKGQKVRFRDGMFLGKTGVVARVGNYGGKATVVVKLKEDGREVTEYAEWAEVVERDNADFLYVLDTGSKTVNVHLNDMAKQNEVHVTTNKDSFTIVGEKKIKEFIRALAIAGDLIAEHEALVVKAEVKFEVPEDGTYSLVPKSGVSTIIFVIKGECYTASKGTGLPYRATTYVKMKVEDEGAELRELDVTGQW